MHFSTVLHNFCQILRFYAGFLPRGWGFALSLCPGIGEFALSKKFPGGLLGGMVRLGTDTLKGAMSLKRKH